MELTKFENRVLNPNYPQKCKWYFLYLGVAFVVIGIGVAVFGFVNIIPKTTTVWEENLVLVRKIVPQTEGERLLANTAEGYLESAKSGWARVAEEKTRSTTMFFLFIGSFLIGTYNREMRYLKLIKKVGAPNQLMQPTRYTRG
jgi:hypothetical protein